MGLGGGTGPMLFPSMRKNRQKITSYSVEGYGQRRETDPTNSGTLRSNTSLVDKLFPEMLCPMPLSFLRRNIVVWPHFDPLRKSRRTSKSQKKVRLLVPPRILDSSGNWVNPRCSK